MYTCKPVSRLSANDIIVQGLCDIEIIEVLVSCRVRAATTCVRV